MANINPSKPLGIKAYGSIGHLSGSRLGPSDCMIHYGQERILTEKGRDKHDRIIVTEKLDGSCVGVANLGGRLVAVGRAGLPAADSPHAHIRQFAEWAEVNRGLFREALGVGERLMGEWVTMAHGTMYQPLQVPFVAFDLMIGKQRRPTEEMRYVAAKADLTHATVLHDGGPISVAAVMERLGTHGSYGADLAEGAVWRVERKGEFDFIGKYVRSEHISGKYMPGMHGNEEAIWFGEAA